MHSVIRRQDFCCGLRLSCIWTPQSNVYRIKHNGRVTDLINVEN